MKQIKTYGTFFLLNFGALALGGLFTGSGVNSDWYNDLSQAPWTPDGWVFGAAWTTIMFCYSIYMGMAWSRAPKVSLGLVFGIQWILNVLWNPVFFYFHAPDIGLLIIIALTLILLLQMFLFFKRLKYISALLLPYIFWLCIATSLNLYIVLFN